MILQRYRIQTTQSGRQRQTSKRVSKRVVELLIEENHLGQGVVSDFRSTILTRRKLVLSPGRYTITCREKEETKTSPDHRTYAVHLQHTGARTLASILDHSTSSTSSSLLGHKEERMQALNILLGHHSKSQHAYTVLGQGQCYDTDASPQSRSSLGAGIEVIRGFVFSTAAATSRLLENVQIENLAFYESGLWRRS